MLRLVHPRPAGQGTDPPRRKGARPDALRLSPDEARHVRAAVRGVARSYGSLGCLAAVIGVHPDMLTRKSRRPSPALALAVARAGGMTMEAVLSGKLATVGTCPTCGHRPGGAP